MVLNFQVLIEEIVVGVGQNFGDCDDGRKHSGASCLVSEVGSGEVDGMSVVGVIVIFWFAVTLDGGFDVLVEFIVVIDVEPFVELFDCFSCASDSGAMVGARGLHDDRSFVRDKTCAT